MSINLISSLGDADNLVKYSYGQMTSRFLAELNGTESYQFITYPNLGHTICLKVS